MCWFPKVNAAGKFNFHSLHQDAANLVWLQMHIFLNCVWLYNQGFAYLPGGICASTMGRHVSYEQAVAWKVLEADESTVHCLAFSFINWSFVWLWSLLHWLSSSSSIGAGAGGMKMKIKMFVLQCLMQCLLLQSNLIKLLINCFPSFSLHFNPHFDSCKYWQAH